MNITSPVVASIAYGCMILPWCLKPTFGYISDKFPIFNWGRRKPYIFFCSLLSSFLYMNVYDFTTNFPVFIFLLTCISACTCFIDVCADSITVQQAKLEKENGVTQSNTWISRATGTLLGFILGGLMYKAFDAQNVLTACSYVPLCTCFVVWYIEEKTHASPSFKDVWNNIVEQKEFVLTLFLFHAAPNYSVFYQYYLKEDLQYSSDDFTYLSILSTMSFLIGLVSYKFYFRKIKMKKLLWNAVVVSSILRTTQIGVVLNWFPYFEVVMLDGIVESFCGQLIMMPLTVAAAKLCNDGLEGSFFSFIMSVMNFGTFLGDEMGALIASFMGVTKICFDNLYILMLIGISADILIAYFVTKKVSFYFENYSNVSVDTKEELDPEDKSKSPI